MKFKKTLENFLVGAGIAISALAFNPSRARADDVLATNDISYVTAIDSDGDRLTDAQESLIGTNLNNRDSDGDGFLDGVEAVNPSLNANPLVDTQPGRGNFLYNFATTQNLTTGTLTNSFNPFWFPGGRIAYIESDANFANGGIYIKNINDITQVRGSPKVTGLDAQLRELSSTPRGAFVYFHNDRGDGKTGIWKINRLNGNVTQSVPTNSQELNFNYNLRNPSVVGKLRITSGVLETEGNVWLLAETDNPTSATGQIYAFKLQNTVLPLNPGFGSWDGTNVKQVTSFTSGNRIARSKTSRDGDKIMFQEVNSDGKTRLWIYSGLQNILNNITTPYTDQFLNDRGEAITFFDVNNGVTFPGGFGGANNLVYFTQDRNDVYRLTSPLNFSGADFDIVSNPVGFITDSNGTRFRSLPPGKVRIPLPGNQITPSVSKEGRRLAFADDYLSDGVPGGNFNLYATSIAPLIRLVNNMGVDILNNFTDSSGLTFFGGRDDQRIDLTTAVPDSGYSTNTLAIISPLKAVSDSGSYGVTNIGRFGPSGLKIKYGVDADKTTSESLKMRQFWNVEDLVINLDDSGNTTTIDESTIQPMFFNNTTQQYEALPAEQNISINRTNRVMEYFTQHFSNYAIGGDLIQGRLVNMEPDAPNAVRKEDWTQYQ